MHLLQSGGVVAGLASEVDFPEPLSDTPGLGLCLSHTRKHFSIPPSLSSVLLQSFFPAHPIYNSLVLARVEQTGESGTVQAPSLLVTGEAVKVGAGHRAQQQVGSHQAEETVRWAGGQVGRKNDVITGTAKPCWRRARRLTVKESPPYSKPQPPGWPSPGQAKVEYRAVPGP